jgi:hypothetical protein
VQQRRHDRRWGLNSWVADELTCAFVPFAATPLSLSIQTGTMIALQQDDDDALTRWWAADSSGFCIVAVSLVIVYWSSSTALIARPICSDGASACTLLMTSFFYLPSAM